MAEGDFHMCSVHDKKRSGTSLIDDDLGGYKCAPGFECKTKGEGGGKGGGKGCKWCEMGECWTHGGKGGGKQEMMYAMMMSMMGGKGGSKGGFGKSGGKGKGGECKWCAQGECWTHGEGGKGKGGKRSSPY
mmetsp:Transcript_130611/g.418787  ORF Transcript_130611/g.418787 Transcript_130611/m.418787 type:complete len:131 (-) Transcript_130611:50-442(-)